MSNLVGNGCTVTSSQNGQRIDAVVQTITPNNLNATGGTAPAGGVFLGPGGVGYVPSDHGYNYFVCESGPGRLILSAKGHKTRDMSVTFPIPTNINYELEWDGTPDQPSATALHLEVRNNDFVDANGDATCYSGIDRFNVPRMWLDKRYAEVDALIDEQLSLGMNWSRMLFMGAKSQNTIFDLSPDEAGFDQMAVEVVQHHNDRGVGVFGDVFADNQIVGKPMSHFRRMTDLWQGKILIASGGNEDKKNGWYPQELQAPGGGMVWARGSSLADQLIEQNGATAACFHQRTDWPATIMDAVASEVYMASHGYTVCMCDEPTRFDQDGTNKSGVPDSPRFALALGLIYRAMWDLVVFHCNSGQRGELMSSALRQAAENWARGLRA